MKIKILSCSGSIIMGAMLTIGLILLLGQQAVRASAEAGPLSPGLIRYVTTTGNDGGGTNSCTTVPCRTVQQAMDVAANGDEIRVAEGVYTGVLFRGGMTQTLYINKTVTVQGGYTTTNWTTPDTLAQPTVLDAQGLGRVVSISGNVTPTLEGFVITHGNASGLADNCETDAVGCGGGIYVFNAHPVIANNVIKDNNAAVTGSGFTHTTGYGGGLFLNGATRAVVSGNVISHNTGNTAYCGAGGGIYLFMSGSGNAGLQVQSNQVLSNTASTTNLGCAWGGGIHGGPDGALIQGNTFAGNRANGYGGGLGAGIYQWYGSATYLDNLVTGNLGSATGQAVFLGRSRSRFEGNRVVDNATSQGIQIEVSEGGGPILVDNVVARSGPETVVARGFGVAPLTATLVHNTLVGSGAGSGVIVETGYVTLTLTNTIVVGHAWGITNTVPALSTVHVDHTLFWANAKDGIRGTSPLNGNPAFAADGYHLTLGSAAIDRGVNAGVAADIDGDPRPQGCFTDLGADEFIASLGCQVIDLPLVLRNN